MSGFSRLRDFLAQGATMSTVQEVVVNIGQAVCIIDETQQTYAYVSPVIRTNADILPLQTYTTDLPIVGLLSWEDEALWKEHMTKIRHDVPQYVAVKIRGTNAITYIYEESRKKILQGDSVCVEVIVNIRSMSDAVRNIPLLHQDVEQVSVQDLVLPLVDFTPIVLSLLQSSKEGIIQTDQQGRIKVLNPTVFEFFSQKPRDVRGCQLYDIFPFFQFLWEYTNTDGNIDLQDSLRLVRHFAPASRWLQVSLHPSAFGMTIQLNDISKEVLQNEQIRILSLVATNGISSVVVTDAEGNFQWVNRAFEQLTEYSLYEVIGKQPGKLLQGKNTDPETVAKIRHALQARESFTGEIINYSKSGKEYRIRLEISPVFDGNGLLQHFTSVQVDVTDYHHAADTLHAYNERLEENIAERTIDMLKKNHELESVVESMTALAQEQDDILALVAHDLKNPLTSIMLNCSLLYKHIEQGNIEKITKSVSSIERTSERIEHIIKYILSSYQRSNQLSFHAEIGMVNIADVLKNVVSSFQLQAQTKNIDCRLQIESENILVKSDQNALMHIVENLVSNAIKYSPIGKSIDVGIFSQDLYPGYVSVFVRDQGPGFSTEDKKKLFQKFQRLSARPTANEHSTGLGLSLVKKLVQAVRGEIFLNNEYSNGAEFIFCIPTAIFDTDSIEQEQFEAIQE